MTKVGATRLHDSPVYYVSSRARTSKLRELRGVVVYTGGRRVAGPGDNGLREQKMRQRWRGE